MYSVQDVKGLVARLSSIIHENVDELARLDGQSGDGDLGASMDAAFSAMQETCEPMEISDIGGMLMKAAMACNKAAPSTMGTLISSGVMAAAKAFKGKSELADADVVTVPRLFAEAIMARGKAQVGDKTILDALVPMADAVEAEFAASGDLKAAYTAGAKAADAGAKATCGMLAKIGRARWIGERAQEHMDGGAALCAVVAKGLVA